MSDPSTRPHVGRPLPLRHARELVTGAARTVADRAAPSAAGALAGAARAVFVRSPYAHAEVVGVDADPARRRPGVLAVVTGADLDLTPGPFHPDLIGLGPDATQPLLAIGDVRYVGQPVAVVVADTEAAAVDAAEAVEVGYRVRTPVLDLAAGEVVVDSGWLGSRPNPERFSRAPVRVELTVTNPRQSPAPLEGRAVGSVWAGRGRAERLEVWAAIQRPHGFRDELCALYGLERDQVTVTAGPSVGGGFGGKVGRTAEERIVPELARRLGGPVVWVETRSEYLVAATQARGEEIRFVLAGTTDGRMLALRADLVKDAGAYPITGALLPPAWTVPMGSGPYAIDHVELRTRSVLTNRVPTSAFRGAGRAPYIAGLERLVDRFAAEVGLDPADVRFRNLLRPDQLPHRSPTGGDYDEADYPADLATALDAVGYRDLRAEQATRRAAGRPVRLGVGIACYNHVTVGAGGEAARVSVGTDGRATVVTGSTSQGHGHRTTWAQIAADQLGLAVDDIDVSEGSTELIAAGVGAVGSRSAQAAGVAVHRAAAEVVELARVAAATVLEAAPADIVLDRTSGRFHVVGTPARSIGWNALAGAVAAAGDPPLACELATDFGGRTAYPSGSHVAVVEVDTETGRWRIDRFVAVDDAGRRINPLIVDGQLHGGIAAGIAQVLGEVVVEDPDGNVLTCTFVDYAIVTADQLPLFELIPAEVPTSRNELGVKGVGESGTIGATPAVHNAVIDALGPDGIDHLDLPCTPDRVWAARSRATG
ncbi:MAG: xanthine dehydrogenase family protein molybdopterin-binding subunit [Acidimicrobiales bacterium]